MTSIEIPIIIDGPNFINRILEYGIDKDLVANQLSITGVRYELERLLIDANIEGTTSIVEFVCSNKLFGPSGNKFTQAERDLMLERIMREIGVHVEEVNLPGSSEKGVDGTVAATMETFAETFKSIILISNDRDFVPVMKKLRGKGIHIILVSLAKDTPKELVNEAFLVFDLSKQYEYLFTYSYPKHVIYSGFNISDYRNLISNADDRQHNQLRVNKNGLVYISHEAVGSENTLGVQFRFETYCAGNQYVGPVAASHKDYIKREYDELLLAWAHKDELDDYIDFPVAAMIGKNNAP